MTMLRPGDMKHELTNNVVPELVTISIIGSDDADHAPNVIILHESHWSGEV